MIREKGVSAGKGATDAPDPRGMSRRDTIYSKYGMYGVDCFTATPPCEASSTVPDGRIRVGKGTVHVHTKYIPSGGAL